MSIDSTRTSIANNLRIGLEKCAQLRAELEASNPSTPSERRCVDAALAEIEIVSRDLEKRKTGEFSTRDHVRDCEQAFIAAKKELERVEVQYGLGTDDPSEAIERHHALVAAQQRVMLTERVSKAAKSGSSDFAVPGRFTKLRQSAERVGSAVRGLCRAASDGHEQKFNPDRAASLSVVELGMLLAVAAQEIQKLEERCAAKPRLDDSPELQALRAGGVSGVKTYVKKWFANDLADLALNDRSAAKRELASSFANEKVAS